MAEKISQTPGHGTDRDSLYELAILGAEIGGRTPEVDLHGDSVDDALPKLEKFFDEQLLADAEVVKIIHGRGLGKLRGAVHQWLKQMMTQGRVLYFRDAEATGQQGGATYAVLG